VSEFHKQLGLMDKISNLKTLDLDGIAEYIISGKCMSIAFLTGAGISVGAGIPDFRSPGGMYDTLRPQLLTASPADRASMAVDPTLVVSWNLFSKNQFPYLEVRRPFILGTVVQQWKATLSHFFIKVCHDKGLLRRLYTQNIDGLDYQTEIPKEKICNVHGTISIYGCEGCDADYPQEEFREALQKILKIFMVLIQMHLRNQHQFTVNNAANPL